MGLIMGGRQHLLSFNAGPSAVRVKAGGSDDDRLRFKINSMVLYEAALTWSP
jgi:hypothetical protein